MEPFAFRTITPADYPQAIEFKRQTFIDNGGDIAFFDQVLKEKPNWLASFQEYDPESCAFLTHEGNAIGFVMLTEQAGHGFVNNYYITPEWRGKGLGRLLDDYAMDFFRRHGHTKAFLRTGKGSSALHFYASTGWTVLGDDPKRPELCRLGKDVPER